MHLENVNLRIMKNRLISLCLLCACCVMAKADDLKLWYKQPAKVWTEALPLGNSRLGAMVYGGVVNEQIQLNEETVWGGGPHRNDSPKALGVLPTVRELLFSGREKEAEKMIADNFFTGQHGMPFQTIGSLMLEFDGHADYSDYRRELDLEKAIASVRYKIGEVNYIRTMFTSLADNALIVRIEADKPGAVNFTTRYSTPYKEYEIKKNGKSLLLSGHGSAHEGIPGAIRFDDVSFEYPDDHNKVLHHVSLDIKAGERLALVGPSGGGKTTLCNLIPRFYDVTSGHIYIDGQDIQQVTLKSLREDIGIVQQDVYLFSGSVADNIAYGKPDATREEIIEAARLAGAERFIMALKDGFDTYVGERGVKLSGGQKQRIAIARVFLKNPPILILDEATSALDNESEILVGQSLEKLAHGRTTLTIAHRLTTIKNYDRILVLGSEGIVESGTHDQLLAKQGVYYRLWNQLPGEDTL